MKEGIGQARVVSAGAFLLREDDDGDVPIYMNIVNIFAVHVFADICHYAPEYPITRRIDSLSIPCSLDVACDVLRLAYSVLVARKPRIYLVSTSQVTSNLLVNFCPLFPCSLDITRANLLYTRIQLDYHKIKCQDS